MGEVYRARDTKLDRDVAIKVLPEEFAADPERLARFEREAKLLASLNHPNIASIYGFEENALVLELVEGPTLAERIADGPIPVEESIAIAKQIAEALEAGHEAGVIHRDLKPANIKLKEDGSVKVLDYGLAKALEGDAAPTGDSELSQSPTLTREGTQVGVILGTAAYMSPEQAKGKGVDRRSDVWAFGVVLYEMLTGRKAFDGDHASLIMAEVLKSEPDWTYLPESTQWGIRRALRRALAKDAKRRYRSVGDAVLDIQSDDGHEPRQRGTSPSAVRRSWPAVALSAMAVAAVVAIVFGALGGDEPRSTTRLSISLPEEQELVVTSYNPPIALSPDGTLLAYVAAADGGEARIYLRPLDEFEAAPLTGTDGAESVFFSPDGDWIGFFAEGGLRKVPVAGGAPVSVCCVDGRIDGALGGASWGVQGTIVLTQPPRKLNQVPSGGGAARTVVANAPGLGEYLYWPQALTDGERAFVTTTTEDGPRPALVALESGDAQLIELENAPVGAVTYLPTGHLLYSRSSGLWVAPFDLGTLRRTGTPASVADRVFALSSAQAPTPVFTVSRSGTLAYLPGEASVQTFALDWVDVEGRKTEFLEAPAHFIYPRISPDGRRIAVTLVSEEGQDIWLIDRERGSRTLFANEGQNMEPVWSPDGNRIAFASNRAGSWSLYWKPADGSREAEPLLVRENVQFPTSWSPDGRFIAFYERAPEVSSDVLVVDLEDELAVSSVVSSGATEHTPVFSPDGASLAYVSDETGREEIYLRPYPGPGGALVVSTDGGREPWWSADGTELYFRSGREMLVVAIRSELALEIGTPRVMFRADFTTELGGGVGYTVAADSGEFLMTRRGTPVPSEIYVVMDWFAELERLVPNND